LPSHSLLRLGLYQISAYRSFDKNIIRKTAALHLTLALFCGWGYAELSLQNIEYNCAYVLIDFSYSSPHSLLWHGLDLSPKRNTLDK
jgi:hypothetical protein